MRRNSYTDNEIVLCTYAALYDEYDFGGVEAISRLTGRSVGSIKMKIQNIAAMLDEEGIPRNSHVSPLTGTPPGQSSRRTNWELVEPITRLPQQDLQKLCVRIVAEC